MWLEDLDWRLRSKWRRASLGHDWIWRESLGRFLRNYFVLCKE
jgi:hypothetical protein